MIKIDNLDLTSFNSYNIKSVAQVAYFPETIDEIKEVIQLPRAVIIGGGCNVIFSKERYDNPIVFIRENFAGIIIEENTLRVKAGVDLKALSIFAYDHSLHGLEYYYDIPGCVGGATIMNAGCQGVSFCDAMRSITYLDLSDLQIYTISTEDACFEYRGNIFKEKSVVILEVELELEFGNPNEIYTLMMRNKENRYAKQPRNLPSAGSVFKRPVGRYVGPMVSDCGLKGFRIGDAMVSEKHAGFIVNVGSATGEDVIKLIDHVKAKVMEKFNITLDQEQRVI